MGRVSAIKSISSREELSRNAISVSFIATGNCSSITSGASGSEAHQLTLRHFEQSCYIHIQSVSQSVCWADNSTSWGQGLSV
jgi:hypothetical protein